MGYIIYTDNTGGSAIMFSENHLQLKLYMRKIHLIRIFLLKV